MTRRITTKHLIKKHILTPHRRSIVLKDTILELPIWVKSVVSLKGTTSLPRSSQRRGRRSVAVCIVAEATVTSWIDDVGGGLTTAA